MPTDYSMRPFQLELGRGLRFSTLYVFMPELYSALGLHMFVLFLCPGLETHLLMALPKVNDILIRWLGTLLVYECPFLLMALPKVEGPYRQCQEGYYIYIHSQLMVDGTFRRFACLPGVLGLFLMPYVCMFINADAL